MKAVLMLFNIVFMPMSRSRFKQRQIPLLISITYVLRFYVNFKWLLGILGLKEKG